jgi:hypothetical protein
LGDRLPRKKIEPYLPTVILSTVILHDVDQGTCADRALHTTWILLNYADLIQSDYQNHAKGSVSLMLLESFVTLASEIAYSSQIIVCGLPYAIQSLHNSFDPQAFTYGTESRQRPSDAFDDSLLLPGIAYDPIELPLPSRFANYTKPSRVLPMPHPLVVPAS